MASSSLSQESLDRELNVLTKRNKIKVTNRNRSTYSKHESFETTDDHDLTDLKMEELMSNEHMLSMSPGFLFYDHESPNRFKVKDKRWLGYPHKAKPLVKDKRKLREKRRSSGVMHVQSTESSEDLMDESECNREQSGGPSSGAPHKLSGGTHSEVIDADNPQTPEEDHKVFTSRTMRNKSPSDLDADLEDNQDYDSTVSQPDAGCSRTNSSANFPTLPTVSSCLHDGSKTEISPSDQHYNELSSPNRNEFLEGESSTLERTVAIEERLAREQEKNKILQNLLKDKDQLIVELEKQIVLLSQKP